MTKSVIYGLFHMYAHIYGPRTHILKHSDAKNSLHDNTNELDKT